MIKATITLPEDVMNNAKTEALRHNVSLSSLIKKKLILSAQLPENRENKMHMKLGKYSFGTTDTFRRERKNKTPIVILKPLRINLFYS